MSDDNKLTLGARPPLGLKRTESAGNVKQSFSHGRTNSVQVEVKRRRLFAKPGEAPPAVAPAPEPVAAPEPVQAAPVPTAPAAPVIAKPVAPPPPMPVYKDEAPAPVQKAKPKPEATPEPTPAPEPEPAPAPVAAPKSAPAKPAPPARPAAPLTRKELQEKLLREAEEERLRFAAEARAREEREGQAAAEAERIRLEEKRKAEEAARVLAEAEAKRIAALPPSQRPVVVADDDDGGRRGSLTARRADAPGAPKPVRGRDDDRRRAGKLTVTRALDDEDGVRARSLAALRRAREKDKRAHQQMGAQPKQARDVTVPEAITVQELANRMAERSSDVIKALFRMGVMATINQTLDQDTAELLVTEFGHNVTRVSDADVEIDSAADVDADATLKSRPPVVTIMGHVDHGKTSLLDALRGTDIVAGEAGGITQHIGAYQVKVKSGDRITFLDTPGHEAFTEMRARGANVTDIVVVVVAGDDGLMPQSIEAINHTKAAGVPMIVAINKMDKPGSDANRVRQALLQHDVQVERMGGEVQDVEVSALKKTGLDDLIEKILLQAEILELKANPDRAAEGTVIEAKLDKGRGPLATVLVGRGTLKVGDVFVIGAESGKVRALIDDKGRQLKEAGPAMPVEVLGLSGVPSAGDPMTVVENEARAREVAAYRQGLAQKKRTTQAPTSLESMFSALKTAKAEEYPVVVKADVQGSVEAIVGSLNKLSTDEIKVRVLHAGVGAITESDVSLARASGAPIIGFGVRANAKAREVAQQAGVEFKYYDVIYELLDETRDAMSGKLSPERIENILGRANVLEVFAAGKGKAAGLRVVDGVMRRNLKARVMRDDVIIWNGNIASLRRFKDDVNEVRSGLECGLVLENNVDVRIGDIIETYEIEERARTL
jgi:translation initiation factor IF-2